MLTLTAHQVATSKPFGNTAIFEASDLNLAPGVWPDHLAVIGKNDKGYLFTRDLSPERSDEGDLVSFTYRHPKGFSVTIFND